MKVVNEISVARTPRVLQLSSIYDITLAEKSRREWDVDLPLGERDWSVGLIVGPSGAGKSTVARALFPGQVVTGFEWPNDRSVLDGFPAGMGIKEITSLIGSVGFNSPPSWLRPFHALSTGEQFRVTVARALAESDGLTVIDEFTSTVDRQAAQIASHTVQKAVRKRGTRLVAVTCHYDVLDWLQPDWTYEPGTDQFTWRVLQQRPGVPFDVYTIDRSAWRLFGPHHYLSSELLSSARCFGGFVDGQCVAFTSYRVFPHPTAKDIVMTHRLVVLPDWQGLGLGVILHDWMAAHLASQGKRCRLVAAHPALIASCSASLHWRAIGSPSRSTRGGVRGGRSGTSAAHGFASVRRLQVRSFEYVA